MSDWYYGQGGQQKGPVSRETLGQLVATGQLAPHELVWTAGMAAWQPAGGVPGLFAPGTATSVPPQIPIGYASGSHGAYPRQPRLGDDAGVRFLLPVGRSGWAIAAGYMGLFSVLLVPAPIALILSIVAIRDMKRHPDRHGMGRAIFGLIMGIIFTIFLGIFVVAAVANHR